MGIHVSTTETSDASEDTATATSSAMDAIRAASTGDDRLAYRGVFQRMFVRPEIGAIIGLVGIWAFFWAVSGVFGEASGSTNYLDQASTLGIMAVAVSMLMVGGEFDLSSGANTGAMGMLTIYVVKETGELGGLGLPIWLGLIVSFLIAMGIGWLNGFMVDRTQLPSFIVTLATFFVLIGLKLGLAKRLVGRIDVGRMDEGQGFNFFYKIFGSQWYRNEHVFGGRDAVYTVLVLGGLSLAVLALYEMHFERRERMNPAGIPVLAAGAGAVVAGIAVLHLTDSIPMNWVGALVIAVGAVLVVLGLGAWRFQPGPTRGRVELGGGIGLALGAGLAGIVIAFITATSISSADESGLFFPFTVQGFRATMFGLFMALGMVGLFIASIRARRKSVLSKAAVSGVITIVLVLTAFLIQLESRSYKFRVEAFSVVLVAALMMFVWAVASVWFVERTRVNRAVDRLAGRALAAGLVVAAIGMLVKTLFVTTDQLDAGVQPAQYSMRIVWFAAFTAVMVWVLTKTRFGNWTYAVGGNAVAARHVGVPAARTKTRLFMLVSGAAWLVGVLIAFRINSIQANSGNGDEFIFIIAAVVGGSLLTGGYGTALGGAIGALVMAMAIVGIPASRWESDWRFLFLGVILLAAVIANRFIKDKAEALRR